ERDRVRAEIHLAAAVADRERRALARADHQVVLAGEQESQRKGAAQLRQRRGDRLGRRLAAGHFLGDQMGHHLGVGLAAELVAVLAELLAQLAEILDDAVVHDRDALGGMGMGVALARLAVRRPAGVADADGAGQRLLGEPVFERLQFALGTAPPELAVIERGDAGGDIAAVFDALERIDHMGRDRPTSENSDDAAHPLGWPLSCRSRSSRRRDRFGHQNALRHVTGASVRLCAGQARFFGTALRKLLPKALTWCKRLTQPSLIACLARATASAPAGTSLVITEPEPI